MANTDGDANAAAAVDGERGGEVDAGSRGGEAAAAPSAAAAIAARVGGAFARKPTNGADDHRRVAGDDGVDPASKPGATEWPEWLPEKFRGKARGEVRTEELATAYSTLEAAHTALKNTKGWGKAGASPDDYVKELAVPEGAANLDHIRQIDVATDPAVGVFRKVAHKHKLPVDVATGLMLDFLTELNPIMPAPQTEADIIAELGEGGAAVRDTLGTWLEAQFNNKTFSEGELEFLYSAFGGSAVGLRTLAKVRAMTGEQPIPLNPGRQATDIPSVEEWYALNTDPRMATDLGFRAKIERWGEQLFGDEPAGSSEAGVGVPPVRKIDRRERASTQR